MNPQTNLSILAQGLARIHRAISRGLNVGIEKGNEFKRDGFPSDQIKKGYTDYILSLAIVLSAHHLSEDEVSFPKLKEMIPSAPFGRLQSDHHKIEGLLLTLRSALSKMVEGGSIDSLSSLVNDLSAINDIWIPHIQIEETYFSDEAITNAMDLEAEQQINGAIGTHAQEHSVPGYLALPFVLYNLVPDDRAEIEATMPDTVKHELIPIVWKDQWVAMKPFFLD